MVRENKTGILPRGHCWCYILKQVSTVSYFNLLTYRSYVTYTTELKAVVCNLSFFWLYLLKLSL